MNMSYADAFHKPISEAYERLLLDCMRGDAMLFMRRDGVEQAWRVMQPLVMRKPGRTLYEDNRRMEELVRDSELDWTIVRACWLFNSPGVTDYQVTEGNARGMFTARTDFAACMLAQLADEPWVRKTIGVTTTTGTPRIVQQIWHEGIKKEKKS